MKILVTGAAGFIGSYTVKALASKGHQIVGIDCINSYYDTRLKYARLHECGIAQSGIRDGKLITSERWHGYRFLKLDLTDRIALEKLFAQEQFGLVINLAAQAGVRYSIENPYTYVESNIVGFLNLLEACRNHQVSRLIYASSSSVYGMSSDIPYREDLCTDFPVSMYAATKKCDELMAHVYSKLYGIATTGLRFFTVYGPWGRPDMAPCLFMESVLKGTPIRVFNHGNLSRDFTYIEDILAGIMQVVNHPQQPGDYKIYNIGHSEPVQLMEFIGEIERVTGRKAILEMTDMQPGDVYTTFADTSRLWTDFGYRPTTSLHEGMKAFYQWYISFYC